MTYRYLSVLWGEAAAMITSYKLRGGGRGIQIRDSGPFLGQLILRSFDRANRVYQAMGSRGFKGNFSSSDSLTNPLNPAGFHGTKSSHIGDVLYTVLLCGAFVGLRWFNLSRFLGFAAASFLRNFSSPGGLP
jgi:cobalt/nickel transport system permease protein